MNSSCMTKEKKTTRDQSSKVRKHMNGLRWCGVPRMHHYDPGNIQHLYLVTFTLQQLFTLWPLTWNFLWIWPLSTKEHIYKRNEFGLFTRKEPCVMLNLLVFVKQHASRKSLCSMRLQGAVRNQQTTHSPNGLNDVDYAKRGGKATISHH